MTGVLIRDNSLQISLPQIPRLLMSPLFIKAIIGAVIAALLLLMASAMQSEVVSQNANAMPDAQAQLQAINQNFQQVRYTVRESRVRDDLDPNGVLNGADRGTLQALTEGMALQIRYRMAQQQADPNHPNFAKSTDEIAQSYRKEAMKLLVNASSQIGGELKTVDPSTGEMFSHKVDPETLAAIATLRLEAIGVAQDNKIVNQINLDEIRREVAAQEQQLKSARADVLEATGQKPVAESLRQVDAYGIPITIDYQDNSGNSSFNPAYPGG